MKMDNDTRKRIYRRDHYRCTLCDSDRGLQVHHIVHRGQGGSNQHWNLITLCWRCHSMAHGVNFPDMPMSPEDVQQGIYEYMADLYVEFGLVWNPWAKELDRIDNI